MCWSLEVSATTAISGWMAIFYLMRRKRASKQEKKRDYWYSLYLFTFTLTQLVDMILWYDHQSNSLSTCSPINHIVTKYVIPTVIFIQHVVQSLYPSQSYTSYRIPVIIFYLIPCLGMSYQFNCSTLMMSTSGETICWGGVLAETWQIIAHSGLVALGFLFLMPLKIARPHLLTLAIVIAFLSITEGHIALGSKWCSYCLIYAIVYISEPWWLTKNSDEQLRSKSE